MLSCFPQLENSFFLFRSHSNKAFIAIIVKMSHLIMFYIKLTYIIGTVWEPSCKPSYHEMKLFYENPSMGEIPKHKQSNQCFLWCGCSTTLNNCMYLFKITSRLVATQVWIQSKINKINHKKLLTIASDGTEWYLYGVVTMYQNNLRSCWRKKWPMAPLVLLKDNLLYIVIGW